MTMLLHMGSSFLPALLAIWGLSLLLQRVLALDSAFLPLCTVSSIGVVQYIAACFNQLQLATISLQVLGVSALVMFCLKHLGGTYKRQQLSERITDLSAVNIYVLALIFLFFYNFSVPMLGNDDYAFWGLTGKYIFLTKHLPGLGSPILPEHLTYTLGNALFHYFFEIHADQYYPGLAYTAHDALLLAALSTIMYQKKLSQAWIAFILGLLVLCLCNNSFFMSLMVDTLLSLYFFAILFIIFSETRPLQRHLGLLMPLVFLPLIKLIGFYFGIMGVATAFLVWIFDRQSKCLSKSWWHEFLALVLAVMGLILVWWSWSWRNAHFGFTNAFVNPINLHSITAIFSSTNENEIYLRTTILKELLFSRAGGIHLPFIVWFFSLVLGFFLLVRKLPQTQDRRKFCVIGIMSLLVLVIYFVMLFFLESITFAGLVLSTHGGPSLERYLMICVTPIVLFFCACVIKNKLLDPSRRLAIFSGFIVCLFILVLGVSYKKYHTMEPEFADAVSQVNKIQPLLTQNKSGVVCIVEQNRDLTRGYQNWAYLYELPLNKLIYLPGNVSKNNLLTCGSVIIDQTKP